MNKHPKDIFLKELFNEYEMSVRAFNVCDKNGLKNILDLHNHIAKHNDLMCFQNCGRKTSNELLEISKKYYSEEVVLNSLKVKTENKNKITIIPDSHFELLFKSEFEKLGVRAKNALIKFFDDKYPSKDEIQNSFIEHKFNPNKLRNIGNKTSNEINQFVDAIISIFNNIEAYEFDSTELTATKIEGLIGIKLSDKELLKKFDEKQFQILTFSVTHLDELLKLNKQESFILKNFFGLLDRSYSVEDIAKECKWEISKVKRKRESLLKIFSSVLRKLKILLEYSEYSKIIPNAPIIKISEDFFDTEIQKEIQKVGNLFSCYILEILFSDYYSLTKIEQVERPKNLYHTNFYNKLKVIKNEYLIKKSVIQKNKLLAVYKNLLGEICMRNEYDRKLQLSRVYKGELNEELYVVLSSIFKYELDSNLNKNEIFIKRNTPKLVYEYVYDAIEKIGKPAHVSTILKEIKNNYPEFDSNENTVRSSVIHYKDLFISFGRSSTFGLKEWESKYENIKGGTIRDIVEEFLEMYNEPCHISAITEYVNRYRKTDDKSIITNLKLTAEKRFTFFYGAYVGLTSKNYEKLNEGKKYDFTEVSLDNLMSEIFSK